MGKWKSLSYDFFFKFRLFLQLYTQYTWHRWYHGCGNERANYVTYFHCIIHFVFYFIDYTISKFCWSECTEARSSSLKDDKFQYCKFLFYNRYKEMFRVACFIFIQSNYLLRWTSNLKAENYVIGTDTCRVKSYRRNTENVSKIGWNKKII